MFSNRKRDQKISQLEAQNERPQKQIDLLESRFNEWFDLVAVDLGYEAATVYNYFTGGSYAATPRSARVKQVSEVVRTKTARCK